MGVDSDALSRLSPTQNLLLGVASGLSCKLTNYPLLSWKNATQQGLPLKFNLSVYRGLPMAMMNLGGTTGVQFWSTGFFQRLLVGGKKEATSQDKLLGSLLGGAFSGVPCSIWELIMIQQQRFGGSIASAPMNVINKFGAPTMLRGVICTMGRESLFTMSMLAVTPLIQEGMVEKFRMDPNLGLAAGALIGSTLAAIATHPMDTIKTCMQGDCEQKIYTNIRGTYKTLLTEGGVPGLFKGLGWRIGLIATTFFFVNKFKEVLLPVCYPNAVKPHVENNDEEKK